MVSDTKTDISNGVRVLDIIMRSLDVAIEKLVGQKKDVERRLVDLKAENSIFEDEIKNTINSGQKFLEGIGGGNVNNGEVEGFIGSLNSSTLELGRFADTVTRRKTILDKNREIEKVLDELRISLNESIDGLENIKSLLLSGEGDFDEKKVNAIKACKSQAAMGTSAIIRSQEMERQRIAREIHDGPAQAIANVVLRLDIVNKIFDKNPSSVPAELEKMKELAQHSLNEIRGFIFDLRPMTLQDLGLAATIKRAINSMSGSFDTNIQFILEGDERELHPDIKLAVFRIAQESLNNIRKHANAKSAWVQLKYFPNKVILIVEDDGIGFERSKIVDSQRKYISFGLLGMRERADDINASLEIISTPGHGTKVTVVIIDIERNRS